VADGGKNPTPGGGGGQGQGPGQGPGGSAANVRLRAEEVVERGLRLYAHGDLVGALAEWRRALEIDRGNRRGRDYVSYVEDHFEVLNEKFRAARERRGGGAGPAIEIEADDPEEIDPYESIELEGEATAASAEQPDFDGDENGGPAPGAPNLRGRAAGGKQGAGRRPWGGRRGLSRELDEHWPMDDSWPSASSNDTLEMAVDPSVLDDLEDLGGHGLTGRADSEGGAEVQTDEDGAEPSAILLARETLDDALGAAAEEAEQEGEPGTGEITLPARSPGFGQRLGVPSAEGSGPLDPGIVPPDLARRARAAEEEAWADGTPPVDLDGASLAELRELREEELREVRVTFRRPTRAGDTVEPAPAPVEAERDDDDGPALEVEVEEESADDERRDDDDDDEIRDDAAEADDDVDEEELTLERGSVATRSTHQVRNRRSSTRELDVITSARDRLVNPRLARDDDRPAPVREPSGRSKAQTDDRLASAASAAGEALMSFPDDDQEPLLLRPKARPPDTDRLEARTPRRRPASSAVKSPPPSDSVERAITETSQRRLPVGHSSISIELVSAELLAELDRATARHGAGEDKLRDRVGWLIDRARRENQAGHYPIAVVAADLALDENPESAVTQKLIHSNRELLYEIYGNYLGDMDAVPGLALPMSAIPMNELDHRAAFLLSRVDGVLSLEDVLDVAGMARLEAFRHLSRLMLRGILEIRQ